MRRTLRWGTIGSGWIAHMFANTMKFVEDSEILGVADSSREMAVAYQKEFAIPRVFSSPEELAASTDIDAIYVATPHCFHKQYIELALNQGKHVLCVKPIVMNAGELKDMIALAAKKRLLLMEAMWTRFKPEFQAAKREVTGGSIGEVERVEVHCSFRPPYNPESRLFNARLGGGALLDVGVYAVSLAQFFMGRPPIEIKAFSHIGPTKVDHTTSALLGYPNGATAFVSAPIVSDERQDLVIYGTKGTLAIRGYWYSDSYEIHLYGKDPENFTFKESASDLVEKHEYMLEAFNACVREGKIDNEVIPIAGTLEVVETMGEILRQAGLSYSVNSQQKKSAS